MLIHGGAYVLFSQMPNFGAALFFIALSRAGVAVSSVLNVSQMLKRVPDEFRGRVFATIDSLTWSTMMVSMTGAGIASQYSFAAHHWVGGGHPQFQPRHLLGFGELEGKTSRA